MSGVPIKAVSLVPSSTGTGKLPRGSKSVAILDWLVGARGDVSGSSSMAASSSSCGITVSHISVAVGLWSEGRGRQESPSYLSNCNCEVPFIEIG